MKRLFSMLAMLMISFGMVLGLVACDKKDNSNDNTGGSGDGALTTQQILEYAADEVNDKLSTGNGCFASKTGEVYNYLQYDENVYLGLNLLKEVSKISGVEDSKWYNSSPLDVQDGKVDKVLALKISSATENDIVTLNLIVKFSIKGLDTQTKTKSYNLYNYVIGYNKETKDVSVDAVYEKSRDIENLEFGDYSVSNYFKFVYDDGVLVTTQFKRNIDIEDLENSALINNSSIGNYNFLKFDTSNNSMQTEIDGFDVENALKASVINSVKEMLVTMNNVNDLLTGADKQEIQVNALLLKASDAENISQLA